ncbi:hypothetical protein [Nannocystis exedens]|nr:hypothetical protein [Nannocystis exedens]
MQNALSIAMLLGKSFVEADRCRQARLANAGKRPTTLDDVMEKSGLKIPGLQEVLEQLMGSTEEAKKVASMIAENPDPMILLQKFAQQFGCGMPTSAGPVVTPPPNPHAAVPPPSQQSGPINTWPIPPSPTMEPPSPPGATPTWPTPPASMTAPGLLKVRPEFTREALDAARAAGKPPTPWSNAAAAAPATPPTENVAEPRPSLVALVEQRLGALQRRVAAHDADLDLRLKHAEAELAKLRQELHELRAGKSAPVPVAAPSQGQRSAPEEQTGEVAAESPSAGTEAAPESTLEAVAEPDVALPLPLAATEQELARAIELIGEFTEVVDQHHMQSLVRVVALEQEVSAMRALVERERQAAGASADG